MPKIVDRDAYRTDLLDRAFTHFADQGFGAVTMRGLAQSLNVSTGTLYHYFDSKQAVFEQLARRIAGVHEQVLLDTIAEGGDSSVRLSALAGFVHSNEETLRDGLGLLLEFHRAIGRHSDNNVAAEALAAYRRGVRAHLDGYSPAVQNLAFTSFVGWLVARSIEPETTRLGGLLESLVALLAQAGPTH